MQQKINLYKLLPKKTGFVFSKKTSIFYGIFVFILFIFYVNIVLQKKAIVLKNIALTTEVQSLQMQLNNLSHKYPVSNATDLQKSIKTLQEDLDNKNAAVDLLISYAIFAEYMVALSNAATTGVWYTDISFNRGVLNVSLKGYAVKPILLTDLLTQLTHQAIFKNMEFNLNQLREENVPITFLIISNRVNQT